ncbi:MAG TPA: hypothetical protein DDZ89_06250 [Clostridiales bacterium]|nr:hypothetical protein [Clostridiales bacterium]
MKKLSLLIATLLTVMTLSPLNIMVINAKAVGSTGIISLEQNIIKTEQHVLPILMYHSISDHPIGLEYLSVRSCDFNSQMKYLMENNYTPLDLNQIHLARYYKKPIIITFDDGYRDNYLVAYSILKEYGFKATIMLIVNNINRSGYMSQAQIKKMSDLISFQCHTASHCDLYKTPEKDYYKEYITSKSNLEAIAGKPVYALSYPFGRYNDSLIRLLSEHYQVALCSNPGFYNEKDGPYKLRRITIRREDTLEDFINKIEP